MKKMKLIPALLTASLLLGCGQQQTVAAASLPTEASVPAQVVALTSLNTDELFSNRDLEGSVDLSKAQTITLSGSTAKTDAPGVSIEGSTVTIGQEGVYLLSGTLEGQIIVNAGKNDKVQLVLSGADIRSASSAAIYCKAADKVFLTLAEGTQNRLSNAGTFTAIDDTAIDGAVYAKTDLTLNGTGSLTVDSPEGHGIVSKDELVITEGSYEVNAGQHGLTGKDCICIAGGNFRITAGEDGIHAKHSEDASAGFLFIRSGSFVIDAAQDGISATGLIEIQDGSFQLTTGGGSRAVEMRPSDGMARSQSGASAYGSTLSAKGIKADGSILIQNGSFQLDCADDGIHTGGNLEIQDGQFQIQTADDGIHSDENITINGSTITIPYCYEGIEGQTVTIHGGSIDITAQDDGINAAGGMDQSGIDISRQNAPQTPPDTSTQPTPPSGETAQRPARGQHEPGERGMGGGRFGGGKGGNTGDSNAIITVNGGTIKIQSQGDSLDSNGSIVLTGGTLSLNCAGFGNSAIDCDGSFTNNGAQVTTNDGSENGTMFTGRKTR